VRELLLLAVMLARELASSDNLDFLGGTFDMLGSVDFEARSEISGIASMDGTGSLGVVGVGDSFLGTVVSVVALAELNEGGGS